ncbi:hypothetical protein [Methylicorpusculum sp.]|uniref:hypothetical protein n=1 Tax=Methylicorpusculum sp. TaxID=2713644 RepID=UPI002AB99FEB|nr:hypothetical protein [Methylicorpusculum sp.]MDZ4153744.1 hypothetical protein [Methylicorpusculum sp.]
MNNAIGQVNLSRAIAERLEAYTQHLNLPKPGDSIIDPRYIERNLALIKELLTIAEEYETLPGVKSEAIQKNKADLLRMQQKLNEQKIPYLAVIVNRAKSIYAYAAMVREMLKPDHASQESLETKGEVLKEHCGRIMFLSALQIDEIPKQPSLKEAAWDLLNLYRELTFMAGHVVAQWAMMEAGQ